MLELHIFLYDKTKQEFEMQPHNHIQIDNMEYKNNKDYIIEFVSMNRKNV